MGTAATMPENSCANGTPIAGRAPWSAVRLAQRDGLFAECGPGERTARFQAAGRNYNVWPQIVPALQRLSSRQGITVRELCAGIGDQQVITALIAALETLARDGVILKEAPQAIGK
jgi:hypothetical protein